MTYRRSRSHPRRRTAGPLFLIIAAGLVLAGSLGWAVWAVPSRDTAQTAPETEKAAVRNTAQSGGQSPTLSSRKILAQGTDLTGLTAVQAREKLMAAHPWNITVSYEDHTYPIPNPLEKEIDRIINAISNASTQDTAAEVEYTFNYEAVAGEIAAAAEALAGRLDRKPVDSQLESYDRSTGVYQYSQARSGLSLNQKQLTADILEAARRQDYQAVITPVFQEIPPSRTQAQAKEQYQVIGTFTTRTTDNKNRNQNIRLAVDAIDGRILKPGEEFSFNQATGNRTSEKGYQPAGAYKNGILIEEPGGGVCQVSTTLYHAIINSGFMTTERNAHSFPPSYVELGQDAMVSFDGYAGPDLKFVNTQSTNVALRAAFSDNQLKLSIVGLPVLEEGVTVSIRSEKVNEAAPLEPVYEENPELAQGVEKEVEKGKTGTEWRSYRVLSKDGQIIEEKPLHRSSYKGKAPVIQRGTAAPADNSAPAQDGTTASTGSSQAAENADGSNSATTGNADGSIPQSSGNADNSISQSTGNANNSISQSSGNVDNSISQSTGNANGSIPQTLPGDSGGVSSPEDTPPVPPAQSVPAPIEIFPGASLPSGQTINN